ncbi:NUDIX domain-containing protein [Motiliproteus coralliicola]|uniref:NUDIX domain-containing protein n=1 Tax=Motiliproteus coralliicola TaxID=2283196 RepID=A0A369WLT4_9GAMM|nr:NUDIX hydrolase [Motiliproteus coralliicola]RDE22627.1 NUDIX domain-containing protein [Motiliproteus coralliicola]
MNYCSECGAAVHQRIPEGDNRPRYVCSQCDTIHYQNPRIIAGCLPVYGDKVLLCKRAIEPCYGLWTLPAGFMENGETTQEAAMRETREEACAEVELKGLYTITSITPINQVQMFYLAEMPTATFDAGEETLEAQLFAEDEIPWDQLAFRTVINALKFYFEDRKSGNFPMRHVDITGERNRLGSDPSRKN